MVKSILLLENGLNFIGTVFGCKGTTIGEICFNTSMTGYQEVLTDPSYYGQIVTMTYPQIGNYGINSEDLESDTIQVSGMVVKEANDYFSNFRGKEAISDYLQKNQIVGIQGIDTRKLTQIIRDEGYMNVIISSDLSLSKMEKKLSEHHTIEGKNLAPFVSTKNKYQINAEFSNQKIAVIDFGLKKNILRLIKQTNSEITVFPYNVKYEEIVKYNPDGILLSNGPGDPSKVYDGIELVKNLLDKIPIFGICLGHQILSLALGAKTYKMKFGHRGCNHPVKNTATGKVEISSHNHGFSVDEDTLPSFVEVTHRSLNDNSIEGIKAEKLKAFSVQFHPESSLGPHDSKYLFDNFINLINSNKKNA